MILLWMLVATICTLTCSQKLPSIESAYSKGVQAYSSERWSECIAQLEEALLLYKLHKSIATNCRIKCANQRYTLSITDDIEDLKFYEKVTLERICLSNCYENEFSHSKIQSRIDETILRKMQSKKPYEYLHICYYQMNNLQQATSAAYTYFVANPDSSQMRENLEYYIEQPEVVKSEVVDLENEDYKALFDLGMKSYSQKKWRETVAAMEEVIHDYLTTENICRSECERQPEQEYSSEFTFIMSNYIISVLHCKQLCQKKLQFHQYNSGSEFLADILNYLQFAYYHLLKIDDAAQAAATFLLIKPNDEDMLSNKKLFSSLTKKVEFKERQDILYYFKRDKHEKYILNTFLDEQNTI